ncbi:hypothetical protein EJC51_19560 [Streptomyces aquilus]|uniref:Gram-positive cocci surface proteins LPxTG domain-containing protein n=1 Tax=Streptomyces aquilus TaxID=2548456 RepID=A0A3Q9BZD4_9ACTN|nr:hypothetical protein [Streptomyces aquilus]AZP18093.1 hypothetical protein EJC51_19560 [Streptomyces aquilus]
MRLFPSLALPLAATAALLLAPPTPAHAAPVCDSPDNSRAFPLTTRIHGGPATYAPGGGYGTWRLDLTNTTTRTCTAVHPVVVLVDKERALKASQPRLEFYEGGRPRPVRFETTDEDELVGAFGGAGLTVGPGRTVTVKVRLALTSDAVPNQVTVNAAVVQRHDDDGDWVGQSNDYRFAVADDTGTDTGIEAGTDPESRPATGDDRLPSVEELARTGLGPAGPAVAATVALLLTGAALLVSRRRR